MDLQGPKTGSDVIQQLLNRKVDEAAQNRAAMMDAYIKAYLIANPDVLIQDLTIVEQTVQDPLRLTWFIAKKSDLGLAPPIPPSGSETPGFIGTPVKGEKPLLMGLVRDDPKTPEGKYLVKRRDGTVVEWPQFVLGARDPFAEIALRAYASGVDHKIRTLGEEEARKQGMTKEWLEGLRRHADLFRKYREEHGEGDPGRGTHRTDDPATIAEMKKGFGSA